MMQRGAKADKLGFGQMRSMKQSAAEGGVTRMKEAGNLEEVEETMLEVRRNWSMMLQENVRLFSSPFLYSLF